MGSLSRLHRGKSRLADCPSQTRWKAARETSRVLLTIMFPKMGFMIARLMPGKCAKYVTEVFNWLWNVLGKEDFCRLFPALLTDNGTEFSNPLAIEISPDSSRSAYAGVLHASLHCHRQGARRAQPRIHQTHRLQGRELRLFSPEEHVDLMMSHVNNYVRASLMKGEIPCRTPYERFVFEFGEEVSRKLGIVKIPLKEVTLRPELLDMQ